LLARLRNFNELAAGNPVECHSDGNDVRYVIRQAKVRQIMCLLYLQAWLVGSIKCIIRWRFEY